MLLILPVIAFMVRFLKSMNPAKRDIFPRCSPSAPILLILKLQSSAEKCRMDIHQFIAEDPALFVISVNRESNIIAVLQYKLLK